MGKRKPRYDTYITTFFDILGFGKLIDSESASRIHEILSTMREFGGHEKLDRKFAESYEIHSIAFSDNMVRAVSINSPGNLQLSQGLVFNEVWDLAFVQASLAYDGVFLRGGTVIGDLFVEGSTVFGPALVEAYELESKVACYPRILISDHILQEHSKNALLKARHHDTATDREFIDKFIMKDDDDRTFIHYLTPAIYDEHYDHLNLLDQHFEHVKDGLDRHKGNMRVFPKYEWAAKYHNRVVEEVHGSVFAEYGSSRDDYFISLPDRTDADGDGAGCD